MKENLGAYIIPCCFEYWNILGLWSDVAYRDGICDGIKGGVRVVAKPSKLVTA